MENKEQTIDYKAEYEKLLAEKNEEIRLESVGAFKKVLSSKAKTIIPFDDPTLSGKINNLDVKTLNTFADILNDIPEMHPQPGDGASSPGGHPVMDTASFQSYMNR